MIRPPFGLPEIVESASVPINRVLLAEKLPVEVRMTPTGFELVQRYRVLAQAQVKP